MESLLGMKLWKRLLKVRRAGLADTRQKRAKNRQDARWYEKQIRNSTRMMPVYKLGMEALEEDRKKLSLVFQELREHWAEVARLRAAAPSPPMRWVWVHRPGRPISRYTMQV